MSHISTYKTQIKQVDRDLLRQVIDRLVGAGARLAVNAEFHGRQCAYILSPPHARSQYYSQVGVCIGPEGELELLYDTHTAYAGPEPKELAMELQRQYIAQAILKAAQQRGLICYGIHEQNCRIQMSLGGPH